MSQQKRLPSRLHGARFPPGIVLATRPTHYRQKGTAMKIWSDTLTQWQLWDAADKAHAKLTDSDQGKARKRSTVWNVALSGDSPYMQGTASREPGTKAATWDQWGIFLNALFELDPEMTTQYYASATDFHTITGRRFETLTFIDSHRVHKWQWDGGKGGVYCECGATRNYGISASVSA